MSSIPIKSNKRRVVATTKRKKALFSCDRCKTKKIGCQRITGESTSRDVDIGVDCIPCRKAGQKCKTTIKRKKRPHRPIESIGLHYKCLLRLFEGIFPDVDVNSIDIIIQMGINMGINMPSRDGIDEEEDRVWKDATNLGRKDEVCLWLSGKSLNFIQQSIANGINIEPDDKYSHDKSKQSDCFVIDQDDTLHYVGPMGAMNFLSTTVDIIVSEGNSFSLWENYQKVNHYETIISSQHDDIKQNILNQMSSHNFPFLLCINKSESDFYVSEFFEKIHHYCLCFDYITFKTDYDIFWDVLNGNVLKNYCGLSNGFVCSIYMIWILGKTSGLNYKDGTLSANTVETLIGVIKVCLSEMLLTPSLDGIRCMLLLALYLDNTCRRESGYLLLQLSCRQAIAIGLNRESVMESSHQSCFAETMRRTLWSLFLHEARISNQFGRNSCMDTSEISTSFPKLLNIDDTDFSLTFIEHIKLSKILSEILDFRKSIISFDHLLLEKNIQQVYNFKMKYESWYDNLDDSLRVLESEFVNFKFNLILQFRYYYISLLFPYLLLSFQRREKAFENGLVVDFISSCLDSAFDIASILDLSRKRIKFFNILNSDIFVAYYASMCLALGFCLLTNENFNLDKNWIGTIDRIKESKEKILMFNKTCQIDIKGSSRKISKFIDVLLENDQSSNTDFFSNQNVNAAQILPFFQSPSPIPLDPEIASEILHNMFPNHLVD